MLVEGKATISREKMGTKGFSRLAPRFVEERALSCVMLKQLDNYVVDSIQKAPISVSAQVLASWDF